MRTIFIGWPTSRRNVPCHHSCICQITLLCFLKRANKMFTRRTTLKWSVCMVNLRKIINMKNDITMWRGKTTFFESAYHDIFREKYLKWKFHLLYVYGYRHCAEATVKRATKRFININTKKKTVNYTHIIFISTVGIVTMIAAAIIVWFVIHYMRPACSFCTHKCASENSPRLLNVQTNSCT